MSNINFIDCNLSTPYIFQTGFQNVLFKDCKILGLHFNKCNDFAFFIKVDNCQLNHSSFFQAQTFQNADFKNSYNFTIDPENNHIKGAKFTLETVVVLLTKYNIKIEPSF